MTGMKVERYQKLIERTQRNDGFQRGAFWISTYKLCKNTPLQPLGVFFSKSRESKGRHIIYTTIPLCKSIFLATNHHVCGNRTL